MGADGPLAIDNYIKDMVTSIAKQWEDEKKAKRELQTRKSKKEAEETKQIDTSYTRELKIEEIRKKERETERKYEEAREEQDGLRSQNEEIKEKLEKMEEELKRAREIIKDRRSGEDTQEKRNSKDIRRTKGESEPETIQGSAELEEMKQMIKQAGVAIEQRDRDIKILMKKIKDDIKNLTEKVDTIMNWREDQRNKGHPGANQETDAAHTKKSRGRYSRRTHQTKLRPGARWFQGRGKPNVRPRRTNPKKEDKGKLSWRLSPKLEPDQQGS